MADPVFDEIILPETEDDTNLGVNSSSLVDAPFDELILPHTSGQFEQIVLPKKPDTETEAALAETPSDKGPLYDPAFTAQMARLKPGERPPGAMTFAKALDWLTGKFGVEPIAQETVEASTVEPSPEGPSFLNAGIPMIPKQEGKGAQIAAGIGNVPIGFANFLLSPGGTTTLAGLGLLPKAGQVLAGLGFTAEQIKGFFEAETLQDKITTGIGSLFLGGVSAKGIVDMRSKPSGKPQESPEVPPATTERPVEQTQAGDNPVRENEAFVPSSEWQEIPKGVVIPDGGRRIVDSTTGTIYGKWDIPKGEIDALQIRSPESEIPRVVETGENQPGISREARPGESVDTSEARAAEIPANSAKTRLDLILDGVEKHGEVTLGIEGSQASRELVLKVQSAAEARGMTAAFDGNGFLIRKNPVEVTDIPRRNEPETADSARQIERPAETVAEIPENLRRSPEVDRLINEPEAQTGPQMKMAAPTEGGALGFGGGKRATVAPKGTTPRGDTEFLRIEPGYKRILKGLERKGAADVLGETKNKVGKLLSDATRKHVDIEQELFSRISTELIRPIKSVPKKVAARAFDEVAGYLAAKENGRPLPTISSTAQKLVTAWENIADKTGKIAAANGVQVFDPALNASRPMHTIGRQYVPRMFKAEVEQVMRDPASNPRLWNDLVTDFAAQRKIPEADAANQLTREAGKFSSNDFMGNLEMARSGKMPESFYEYDLRNIAARYIPNFSERMAQIISYGQRLGPRENPTRPDLWDIARKESRDPYTQDWLNSAENQAVNLKLKGTAAMGMARAQTAASGLLLSSPTTTVMRNLISGMSATPELLGVRRSIKGFADTIRKSQTRMDAKEIGTVRDNIADFLHADRLGDSPVDNAIRSVVDAGLKYSGYNGSEVFVRTHGTVTAAQFAKDAVAALAKKPTSMRSKEALGLFKRMGVDAAKIVAEKADWKTGPETRKFIRTVIRDTQGGYRFDQVPLWANSNMGRFFFQFGRWGTQRARNIWQNGIKPALGEEVQWHGKTMARRDIRPLAKMLAGTVILGETFAGIAQVLFGRDRRDASLPEISAAWNEDEKKAVGLALQRVVNDVITAGTLGIWSQPIDWAKGLKDQSRLKNPMEPPGLGSLTAFKELGQDMIDQRGELTRRDLWKFTASLVPGVKQMGDVARNVMDEPLYEAENDVRTLRGAAHRWGDQSGLDVSPRNRGDFRKSALAPEYEPIKEALLVGDSQRAKFLASVFLDSQKDKDKARQNLKMSIKMSQPFRAGPYTAKIHRNNFREWAKKNLNEDDYQQTERIQARYQKSAISANLW